MGLQTTWRKLTALMAVRRSLETWNGPIPMTISQIKFGARLSGKRTIERKSIGEVAAVLKLSEPEVEAIESGARKVSIREFEVLFELYGGRNRSEYFSPMDIGGASAAGRLAGSVHRADASFSSAVIRCSHIQYQLADLKEFCDETTKDAPLYPRGLPLSETEARRQGIEVALNERRRLALGNEPIDNVCELIEAQGVDVAIVPLPPAFSGLMLSEFDLAPFIVANESEHVRRRAFSLAHEYAHVLMDRTANPGLLSRKADAAKNLIEVRADAFAGAFLLPEAAIKSHFQSLGKYQRSLSGVTWKAVEPADVDTLANRFHVNRSVVLVALSRLNAIDEDAYTALRSAPRGTSDEFDHRDAREYFRKRYLDLAVRSYHNGIISKRKLNEVLEIVFDETAAETLTEAAEEFECSTNNDGLSA